MIRTRTKAAAVALGLTIFVGATAEGCPDTPPPAPSGGHNGNQAAPPDPAPHAPKPSDAISVRFTVITEIEVVVTYNAGHGNKFIDSVKAGTDSWTVGAPAGAAIYISATPAKRGTQGTIAVKAENAASGKLLCVDHNFTNLKAGADCHGRAR